MATTPFSVDLTTFPRTGLPEIRPEAVFTVAPRYAGAWTVAGDLDGDGVAELVQARLWDHDDVHAVAAVSACRLDGTPLWHWGKPAEGVAALHSDVPCQIHDWNRDGRPEVVVATRSHVVTLDGASGAELQRFPTPNPDAADCLTFANLTGGDRDDLLLKSRYHRLWAFTWDGRPLWHTTDPGGFLTAHQAYPLDLDGDGLDEVVAGYALLDHDGRLLWTLDGDALGLGKGHLDCVRVLATGTCPEQWRLVLTCCGDHALLCLDGRGRLVWQQRGLHFESIHIGRFAADPAERRILVDIDHVAPGCSPLHLYDGDGTLRGEINSVYGRHHPLVAWGDTETDRIVACEDRLLVSGESGEPLARLATPLPAGAAFAQAERPREHTARGEFHLIGQVGNLFGNGRQDLILSTNPGAVVWLYRNPGGPRQTVPLGTGRNVTLY
ncbi:MAG: FG-GAP repeat protein [Lentisphaerae bacterium ADurb.BinA184]|nr:MAG: FG-GAP repeat protein [Lentisphaerae bacterium ADurb.BinA184]